MLIAGRIIQSVLMSFLPEQKVFLTLNCNAILEIYFVVDNVRAPTGTQCISLWTYSGFGGLEVACWPLVSKFAGSQPAETFGFLGRKKSSARLPSEGK